MKAGLYVVTGGAGFIGSHLSAYLRERGSRIRILDNLSSSAAIRASEGIELRIGDVRNSEDVEAALEGAVGVFHLAAVASVQQCQHAWADSSATNALGSIKVFEACSKANLPVVYASSAAVYGAVAPGRETGPAEPIGPYGIDKLVIEMHAAAHDRLGAFASCGLRFFNVYGEGQKPDSPYSGVISIFADRLMRGLPIQFFGSGTQVRDFVYVGDVCRALEAGMTWSQRTNRSMVANVCTGRQTSIRALATAMAECAGMTLYQYSQHNARPGDINASWGDPQVAEEVLSFVAAVELKDGLSRILRQHGRDPELQSGGGKRSLVD